MHGKTQSSMQLDASHTDLANHANLSNNANPDLSAVFLSLWKDRAIGDRL